MTASFPQNLRRFATRAYIALDFGTGYASLAHLLDVPVDVIKIDRSFVARLAQGNPGSAVVGRLFSIARQLDISVVAEGIETEEQANQLVAMGCTMGQGFAFSKAVDFRTASDLLRLYGEWNGASPFPRADDKSSTRRRQSA